MGTILSSGMVVPVKVFITVDTEEDTWNEYSVTHNPVDNISRLHLVQEIFDHYGAIPTYLVTYPVVKNKRSLQILQEIVDTGRCEIGTHCHPWNTPPFLEDSSGANTMLSNLGDELKYKKIQTLHNLIVDHLNIKPISFRAGRWAFDNSVARCISRIGYKVDTSVTPFTDWTNKKGPDFWEAPTFPYWFDPEDILAEKMNGCLLEVPPTVGFFQKNLKRCRRVRKGILGAPFSYLRLLGILDRLKILNYRWLSPEHSSGSEMIRLAKNFVQLGHQCLNVSFHSPSLLPGKTPFVRNEKEFKKFLFSIEMFLQFALDQAMTFLPLSGALENAFHNNGYRSGD